jgi:hypothetical protein
MATLTYDPNPVDQPEFNEAEQEALAIGEAQAAKEQQLLAGKFRDAEELEKAYVELQSKLGSRNSDNQVETSASEDTQSEGETPEAGDAFLDTLWQEAVSGKLTKETQAKLSKMDSADLAAEYIKYRSEVESGNSGPEFNESQLKSIRNIAGGDDGYQEMIAWASENLSPEEVDMYDSVMAEGSFNAINFAVHALKARYTEANGIEGQLLKGKPAANNRDVFRSQAEVVSAMSDPRYERDPAYRQDVYAKLERSELNY